MLIIGNPNPHFPYLSAFRLADKSIVFNMDLIIYMVDRYSSLGNDGLFQNKHYSIEYQIIMNGCQFGLIDLKDPIPFP